MIKGDSDSLITHSYQFQINKCHERKYCKSENEINEWIEDVDVEVWVMQRRLDHHLYGPEPDYIVNELVKS